MTRQTPLLKAALYGSVAMFTSSLAAEAVAQSLAIEEITVTSRKREESLLEIPVSVTAFSQSDIDALGVRDLESLSKVTAGFVLDNVGPGGSGGRQNPAIRFRGLAVQQPSPASRAGAVFWDGGYISDGAGILPLMDLERVEIIKGPQTAFFGRNTFAGAVSYIPAEPGDEFSGRGSVDFSPSQQSSYNVTAAAGGPITDTVGLRVAATQNRKGADFEYDNGDPAGEENTTAITAVSTFQANEDFKLKASGFYVRSDDTRAQQSQRANVPLGSCDLTYGGEIRNVADGSSGGTFTTDLSTRPAGNVFCGNIPDWDVVEPSLSDVGKLTSSTPLFLFSNPLSFVQTLPQEVQGKGIPSAPDGLGAEYKLWRVDFQADYDLANDATISAQFTRGESTHQVLWDNNFGTPAGFFLASGPWLANIATAVQDTYAEARYASSGEERLRYMLGVSYYKQTNDQAAFSSFGATHNLNFSEGKNIGVFGSIDYDVSEEFTVSLEGRWNEDTQTTLYDGISTVSARVVIDPATGLPTGAITDLEQKYDKFMPRVILSYQPMDDMNLYASWSKSNLQGIFTNAVDYSAAVGVPLSNFLGDFTPTQALSAFEVGIKHNVGGWFNYSIAAYHMDWDNQTFFELSPAPFFTAANLSGDARIKGVDIEIDAVPTDWLRVTAGVSYNDVELTDFAGAGSVATSVLTGPGVLSAGQQISAVGNRPRYTPNWTGSISTTFQLGELAGMENDIWLRVDSIYQGNFFVDNFEYNKVAGYWKFNARLHADINDNFAVELYGSNLTNDLSHNTAVGTTSIFFGRDRKNFATLPRKREFGLKFLTNF